MKIVVVGAGAMGGVFGAHLAGAGNDVTLIDVWKEAVDAINAHGLRIEDKTGEVRTVRVRARLAPVEGDPADVVLVFVRCYQTEEAVRGVLPLIGPDTCVLSLQNGWGNAARIAEIVGEDRVLVGVTYHSSTLLGPGYMGHVGHGTTFVGEIDGLTSDRLRRIERTLSDAGLETQATTEVLHKIWSKLALNVCTLPTSALLRFNAGQLMQHAGVVDLMRGLLREAVMVANARDIALSYNERWDAITGLLKRAPGAKASMLQDVEKHRRTEIDVINGAIVAEGRDRGIPTPYNESLVWLIRSLEETFEGGP